MESPVAHPPLVALESTIIAHGMPYPRNVETVLAVEAIVRKAGAQPLTLGILEGKIVTGMTPAQIETLATAPNVWKACERDIALAVAQKATAAVTAGASLAIAARASIEVFVTGGIGAVGPDASRDFDISADLPAIAEYPVLTVCAGAKAFMDIPATLEWLETHRVPVAAWQSDEFPLFYSRSSGVPAPARFDDAATVARFLHERRRLGYRGGVLLAVPLPAEYALPEAETRAAIAHALHRAKEKGVAGKALTPFLLAQIMEITGGRSLESNIALIKSNARIGAEIAVELARLQD